MRDGKIPTLHGLHIILAVRIKGSEDLAVKALDLLYDFGYDRDGFFCAEGAVDEVLLHIDYDQKVFHVQFLSSDIQILSAFIEFCGTMPRAFGIFVGLCH